MISLYHKFTQLEQVFNMTGGVEDDNEIIEYYPPLP